MSITCNAILKKPDPARQNCFTYSLWYGQSYNSDVAAVGNDNLLNNTFNLTSAEDVESLPDSLNEQEILDQFSLTFNAGSHVSVQRLVHSDVICRRFLEEPGIPRREVSLHLHANANRL